ncbi:MAG: site-specific integrase [Bacteroidota bacterium]
MMNQSHTPSYKPAKLRKGKRPFIEFSLYSAKAGKMVTRYIYSFPGSTVKDRLEYAKDQTHEINMILSAGEDMSFQCLLEEDENPHFITAFRYAVGVKINQGGVRVGQNMQTLLNRLWEYLVATRKERIRLREFTRPEVYKFLDWLLETRKVNNKTRNNYAQFLGSGFSILVERGFLNSHPCKGIKKLPEEGHKNVPFTPEQKDKLSRYLRMFQPDVHTFVMLIYYGFIRPVEILRLRVLHVDMKNRVIIIHSKISKNKRQQAVFITGSLYPILKDYLDRHQPKHTDFLFSKGFKPGLTNWHRNRFSVYHSDLLKRFGFYDGLVSGYSWKHTGVCDAYRAGVDIRAIQEQCRHHSLEMTEQYLRSLGLRIHSQLKKAEW